MKRTIRVASQPVCHSFAQFDVLTLGLNEGGPIRGSFWLALVAGYAA
jgi:hypothetical protein